MGQLDESHETKLCPACAERVQSAALICRYCRHDFRKHTVQRGTSGPRLARIVVYTILAVVTLIVLGLAAAANPHTNIPVVSPVVCGLKSGVWVDQVSFIDPPTGCYESAPFGASGIDNSELDECDDGLIYFSGDGLFDEGCYTPEELGEG